MSVSLSGILDFPPWSPLSGIASRIADTFAPVEVLRRGSAPSLLRDSLLLLLLTMLLLGARSSWREPPQSAIGKTLRVDPCDSVQLCGSRSVTECS